MNIWYMTRVALAAWIGITCTALGHAAPFPVITEWRYEVDWGHRWAYIRPTGPWTDGEAPAALSSLVLGNPCIGLPGGCYGQRHTWAASARSLTTLSAASMQHDLSTGTLTRTAPYSEFVREGMAGQYAITVPLDEVPQCLYWGHWVGDNQMVLRDVTGCLPIHVVTPASCTAAPDGILFDHAVVTAGEQSVVTVPISVVCTAPTTGRFSTTTGGDHVQLGRGYSVLGAGGADLGAPIILGRGANTVTLTSTLHDMSPGVWSGSTTLILTVD